MMATLRDATTDDVDQVLALGAATTELHVRDGVFLSRGELLTRITNPEALFLVAEAEGRIVGFAHATLKDPARTGTPTVATLVYLAVDPAHRRRGIAHALYEACEARLRSLGVRSMYGYAHLGGEIIPFMERHGFAAGNAFVWVEKDL